MLEVWTSFTEQTGSNSFVISTVKGDNWSPFPGSPLPDFQDKLTVANAGKLLSVRGKCFICHARTRSETKGMATGSNEN